MGPLNILLRFLSREQDEPRDDTVDSGQAMRLEKIKIQSHLRSPHLTKLL